MARNGSGTYTIPNTFVAGTTITAADHNENFDDLGDEITNSVAVDGQSTMTGQFKAANGTASAPGITFGSDLDCGLYRASANDVGVAVGGSAVVRVSSTGLDVVSGKVREGGFSLLPAGAVIPYAGTTLPDGFLWPIGQVVAQATYPDLYAAVGTTYNTGGEGAGNFRMPDYRGRALFGHDNPDGGGAAGRITNAGSAIVGTTLGASGGFEYVTLAQANLPNATLTVNLPSGQGVHNHTVTAGTFYLSGSGASPQAGSGGSGGTGTVSLAEATLPAMSGTTSSINGNTTQTNVNKMPPAIICHFIIKY